MKSMNSPEAMHKRKANEMKCTGLMYLIWFIIFAAWIGVDADAFNDDKRGFMGNHEKCYIFMGINFWMYLLGSIILTCVACGMRHSKETCTIKMADGIAGFVALYQFGFAIYGCTACWFNDDLRLSVGFMDMAEAMGRKIPDNCDEGNY